MTSPFLLLEQPDDLSIDIASTVRFIRFNRPEKKNALTQEMGRHFKNAILELKQDSNCRVVVLTGEGDCFSAGGDFKFLEQRCNDSAPNNQAVMKSFYDSFFFFTKGFKGTGDCCGSGACHWCWTRFSFIG